MQCAVFAVDALIWRKEFGVKDITEDKLDRGLMDSGSLYARGTDAQGGRVLIFSVRRFHIFHMISTIICIQNHRKLDLS